MAAEKPQSTEAEIRDGMGAALSGFTPFHNQILLGIYIKPEKTSGGVYMTDKTRAEDQYQGKVGVVLKKGPMVFVNDGANDFHGQNVQEGEWVVYRISDGLPMDVGGVHCRLIEDVHVRGTVTDPTTIY